MRKISNVGDALNDLTGCRRSSPFSKLLKCGVLVGFPCPRKPFRQPYLVCILVLLHVFFMHLTTEGARGDVEPSAVVPFARLLAFPEDYDGTRVTVFGYLRFQHETMALYQSKDDADYGIATQALWLYFADDLVVLTHRKGQDHTIADMDRRYVMLTGVFDANKHGHMGAFWGGVDKVDEVRELKRTAN